MTLKAVIHNLKKKIIVVCKISYFAYTDIFEFFTENIIIDIQYHYINYFCYHIRVPSTSIAVLDFFPEPLLDFDAIFYLLALLLGPLSFGVSILFVLGLLDASFRYISKGGFFFIIIGLSPKRLLLLGL